MKGVVDISILTDHNFVTQDAYMRNWHGVSGIFSSSATGAFYKGIQ